MFTNLTTTTGSKALYLAKIEITLFVVLCLCCVNLQALVPASSDFIQKCVALAGLGHFGIINPGLRFAYPGLSHSGLSAHRH